MVILDPERGSNDNVDLGHWPTWSINNNQVAIWFSFQFPFTDQNSSLPNGQYLWLLTLKIRVRSSEPPSWIFKTFKSDTDRLNQSFPIERRSRVWSLALRCDFSLVKNYWFLYIDWVFVCFRVLWPCSDPNPLARVQISSPQIELSGTGTISC